MVVEGNLPDYFGERWGILVGMVPADLDLDAWAQHNSAIAVRMVDGAIISVHPQVYNWHLCISTDTHYYDDDY